MNEKTWFRAVRLALVASLAMTSVLASAKSLAEAPAGQERNPVRAERLAGTWRVQITLRICQTGAALRPAFPAMATYASGGTVTTSDSGFNPALRGAGHGAWNYSGGQKYSAVVEAFLFDLSGALTGRQRLRQSIDLDESGEALTATVSAQVIDLHGNVIFTGCATSVGERME